MIGYYLFGMFFLCLAGLCFDEGGYIGVIGGFLFMGGAFYFIVSTIDKLTEEK